MNEPPETPVALRVQEIAQSQRKEGRKESERARSKTTYIRPLYIRIRIRSLYSQLHNDCPCKLSHSDQSCNAMHIRPLYNRIRIRSLYSQLHNVCPCIYIRIG